MNFKPKQFGKAAALIAIASFAFIGACATKEPEVKNWGHNSKDDGPIGHHEKDVVHVESPVVIEAPKEIIAPPMAANVSAYDKVSNLYGCTGSFTLYGTNGQFVTSGRAYNDEKGLFVLNKGAKTGKIVNAKLGESLLFSPDCSCTKMVEAIAQNPIPGGPPQIMNCPK